MKTTRLALFVLLLGSGSAYSQPAGYSLTDCDTPGNLVKNPAFSCPSDCSTANPDTALFYWNRGTDTTSDYFHPCMDSKWVKKQLKQGPRSMSAMAGQHFYVEYLYPAPYREYLVGRLSCELASGHDAYLEMWVKRDNSQRRAFQSHELFLWPTIHPPGADNWKIVLPPQEYARTVRGSSIVKSKSDWTRVSGWAHVAGGERFVFIGYFGPDGPPSDDIYCPLCSAEGYYFVDDVSVIGEARCPARRLVENRTYAQGTSESLQVGALIRAGFDAGHPQPNGDVMVVAGAEVSYKAGKEIILRPGFSAKSKFHAKIEQCETATRPEFSITGQSLACLPKGLSLGPKTCEGIDNVSWVVEPGIASGWLSCDDCCNPSLDPLPGHSGLAVTVYATVDRGFCQEEVFSLQLPLCRE